VKNKRSCWSRSLLFVCMCSVSLAGWVFLGVGGWKELNGAPWPAEARGSRPVESAVKVKGIRTIKLDAPSYATVLAWSSDSQRLAVGVGLDTRIGVWDVRTGRRMPGPGDQSGGTQAIAYSSDGLFLAVARGGVRFRGDVPVPTGPERYVVSLWDARSGTWVQNLVDEAQEIETFGVSSIVFSPDSRHFAVNYTGGLALYVRDGRGWRRVGALAPSASQVAFSPDGTRLVGTTGSEVLVYEVPSGRVIARWLGLRTGVEMGVRTLAYRPNGSQIAVGEGVRLGFFEPSTGVVGRILEPAPPYSVKGLSYAPNSLYLAVGVASVAYLFDAATFATVAVLSEHKHSVDRLAISPDGTQLAAVGGSEITIWELSGLERAASE
jgi:WD40 repeat protein